MYQLVRRLFTILLMSSSVVIADDTIPADTNEPAIAEPYQSLRAELLDIKEKDRGLRLQMEELRKAGIPLASAQVQELVRKMESDDLDCQNRVKIILTAHGWLSPEQVGKDASATLFFVIQHADTATQKECLPMIRQAVKDKKLSAKLLPLLEDRVALQTGHKQIYGTQIGTSRKTNGYFISPLEDPDNVDQRRAEVGLEPLAEYVMRWSITWDVEAYKKQLPELEAIQKKIRDPKDQKTRSSEAKQEIPEQNKPLQAELLVILQDDQKFRAQLKELQKKLSEDSNEVQELVEKIKTIDAANVSKVTAILDSRGWLGPEDIGAQASSALFLVIQHADLTIQQKYLPMMRAAVKAGKARTADLALLEDRVAMREGRHQIYGSQFRLNTAIQQHYIVPLDDPDNVDKRRTEVGLEPLADYVKKWGILWDVQAYKKLLPELEKLEKDQREHQGKN